MDNENIKKSMLWVKRNSERIMGVFCVILGVILVLNSLELLFHFIIFCLGVLIFYFGAKLLNWDVALNFIDTQIDKIKQKLR